MTIREAIKKAIEGNWSLYDDVDVHPDGDIYLKIRGTDEFEYVGNVIFLDPEFWQCLGKSLVWPIKKSSIGGIDIYDWNYFAREWFESIMEGKSLEDFFKTLQ
jgi:hypothetical protein